MAVKQKTIKEEISIAGTGLHTGCEVGVTFKPAEENSGITFVRMDLPNKPVIKAEPANVLTGDNIRRCTSISSQGAVVQTVEHVMSAFCGLGITNVTVELNARELPVLDGSSIEFLNFFQKAGVIEQSADTKCFDIKEIISVVSGDCSLMIAPSDTLKISYTLDYDNPFMRSQFVSLTIDPTVFERKIAPSRTFCLESEAEELKVAGLGQGATYENALIVGERGVLNNTLRFDDEFARHKILDIIGDLYLLGMPVKGHIFAVKSGHRLNLRLLKKIHQQKEKYAKKGIIPGYDFGDKKELDINDIMKVLPHRYPFLLVDRVFEFEKGKRAVGIKNVTVNDDFFQGHFPTKPVMPGVLMVEAMAQTAGMVVLTNEAHHGKVAFFMGADKVKFRKVVEPGDQLVMEVQVVRDRGKTSQVRSVARVGEQIACQADMMFSLTDISFLD